MPEVVPQERPGYRTDEIGAVHSHVTPAMCEEWKASLDAWSVMCPRGAGDGVGRGARERAGRGANAVSPGFRGVSRRERSVGRW